MQAPAVEHSGRGQRSHTFLAQFQGIGELDTRLKDGLKLFTSFAEFKHVRSTGFLSQEAGALDTSGASHEGGVQGRSEMAADRALGFQVGGRQDPWWRLNWSFLEEDMLGLNLLSPWYKFVLHFRVVVLLLRTGLAFFPVRPTTTSLAVVAEKCVVRKLQSSRPTTTVPVPGEGDRTITPRTSDVTTGLGSKTQGRVGNSRKLDGVLAEA